MFNVPDDDIYIITAQPYMRMYSYLFEIIGISVYGDQYDIIPNKFSSVGTVKNRKKVLDKQHKAEERMHPDFFH